MLNLNAEQLKRLPQRSEEVWQGGFVRMPSYVSGEGTKPYRPWAAFWVAVNEEKVGPTQMCRPEEKSPHLVLEALLQFAMNSEAGGYLPGRVEVRDAALARELEAPLAEAGIEVACTEHLGALDHVVALLIEEIAGGPFPPGALAGNRVTVERMRSFASAAAAFYRAAPWKHLSDEDLLEIRSPKPPSGLRYAAVLGAAGQTFGLGFFDEPQQLWDLRTDEPDSWMARFTKGMWSLTFGDITELPLEDADLWDDHDLPVAGEAAYPCAARFDAEHRVSRPDAAVLRYLEGLLMALARSTEAQIDSGRWSLAVEPASKVKFTITLPDLLVPPSPRELMQRGFSPDRRAMERGQAQMHRLLEERKPKSLEEMNEILQQEFVGREVDPDRSPPRDALESAQDLCYQAFDSIGRRQLQFARQALEICPDCADAFVILAEHRSDVQESLEFYAKGMAAAERVLGKDRFEEDAGHFWGLIDTRPYMRARLGLAECLEQLGRAEETVDHYGELLRLNPNDNQGIRYLYLPLLMELGRDAEAARFMKTTGDEDTANWSFLRALLAFRLGGDSATARSELRKAIAVNPLVVDSLVSDEEPIVMPEGYSPGSPEEAVICACELRSAFLATPGALRWLESRSRPQRPRSQHKQLQRAKTRKKKSR